MIRYQSIILIVNCIVLFACTKTDIKFGNVDVSGDPDIVYYENYPIEMATFKRDSFITSGSSAITLGYHMDPPFGTFIAGSYAELNLPYENSVKDQEVIFDSLTLILNPNGNYYGDTTLPFNIQVYRLAENIENEDEANGNTSFYNPRDFVTEPQLLGQTTTFVRPLSNTAIEVKLSNNLGIELLNKLRLNSTEIQTQEDFLRYFKGIYVSTDSSISNALYSFELSDSVMLRIHYRLNSPTFEKKHIDFGVNIGHQFNHITSHYGNSGLSAFTPFKTQLKSSSETTGKSYLHTNAGSYIKISFPSILNLKEIHPYIKIIRAQLVIKPTPGTYTNPHTLPTELNLRTTNENNELLSTLVDELDDPLNGDLYIDELYGNETAYTFDISSFLTSLISEGQFTNTALMLTTPDGISSAKTDRLVINDQTLSNSIQLKLYVLGL